MGEVEQPSQDFKGTFTLAITGASGFQYGYRLLEVLVKANYQVFVMISKAAHVVAATEADLKLPAQAAKLQTVLTDKLGATVDQIRVFGKEDWMAPVASGSGSPEHMVVCPCSTGTLSAIATGASNNLIERAADVVLKEQKKLILVPREAPFSTIHLENMLKLSRMGAVILPAAPGFYHKPQSVEDMVDFIVARILSHLGVEQSLMPKWGRDGSTPESDNGIPEF
ncbi:aromatic acid decarboxylase [Hahella sp. CCB-MM4]|uniref:flavin prenyltransferase UbiX n=1 Tax=Hahella sp. (strain CCB-MM4) TaxID=1926491 RepID=UPI000B9AC3DE|nr:flavin prenyltransferase UbiX [Hahella sp. CCB-MM4]OZG70787.1 aromatic acid decarboxylase [Hahella sp. CCB-MM4]